MKIKIREAVIDDAPVLADLGARTFRETYASLLRPEDLEPRISYKYGTATQASEIAEEGAWHFIAFVDEQPCGFVRLRTCAPNCSACMPRPLKLDRIYVLRTFQGHGIGKLLMERSFGTAHEKNASYVWLQVLDTNQAVVSFYQKFGFELLGDEPFVIRENTYRYLLMASAL